MCLAVPGKIISVEEAAAGSLERSATVDFQGNRVDVSLVLVPDATVGSWVLVHAGFALSELDEAEALETWRWLREADLVGEEAGEPRDSTAEAGPEKKAEKP